MARSLVTSLLLLLVSCPQAGSSGGVPFQEERELFVTDTSPPLGQDAAPRAAAPPLICAHQRRADLGAPVHVERGGKGGFVRMSECTRLTVIERDERWIKVAFPAVEGRTEGWVSSRYVMDCGPCTPRSAGRDDGGPSPWPPQPEGLCVDSGATGGEALSVVEPAASAQVKGGAKGRPGVEVTVVTYNVFELYDGVGEDAYLSTAHEGTPGGQFTQRLARLGAALARVDADVLLLQEVEGARVACALAAAAWPQSSWSCASTASTRGMPQNVAIASRLQGRFKELRPVVSRQAGPRSAVELSIEGAGGFTVTSVHLKSSRGRSGAEDCHNARRRMGMSAALVRRYEGWSSVLVAGDFNVDPSSHGSAVYDRTDDIFTERRFDRLCPTLGGCDVATYPRYRSAIDLAFFRSGGVWRSASTGVLTEAPHATRDVLGSDHLPLVVTLRR